MRTSARSSLRRARRHLELEKRQPALIDLPIALPSIPVLSPILTDVVAGKPAASSATSPPPESSPDAAPPSPAAAGSDSHPTSASSNAPALINLPIPLPSIPIISPLLTKVIAGAPEPSPSSPSKASPSTSPSSAPAAESTPALIDLPIPLPLPSIPLLSPILTKVVNGAPEPSPSTATQSTKKGATSTAAPSSSTGSALINLPIPLPPIPILSPVLTQIIAGAPTPSTASASAPPPPPPPASHTAPSASGWPIGLPVPLPTVPGLPPIITTGTHGGEPEPTSSASASGSTVGNSGSGDTGNNSGNGSSSGGAAQITAPTPIVPGSTALGTSEGQPGNKSNNNNNPIGSSAVESTDEGISTANSPGPAFAATSPTSSGASLSAITSFNADITSEVGGARAGVVVVSTNTDGNTVTLTLPDSVTLPGATGTLSSGTAIVTFIPTDGSSAGAPGETNGAGPSGNGNGSGNGGNGNGGAASHGLSAGAIAAIATILALLVLMFLLLVARRWHKARRLAARDKYTKTTRAFAFLGKRGNGKKRREEMSERGAAASATDGVRRSVRSSFGTTVDHGARPFTPQPLESSAATLFFTPPASTSAADLGFSVPNSPVLPMAAAGLTRRESGNSGKRGSLISIASSNESIGSGAGTAAAAQYLLAPPLQPDNVARASPISVRPFSPSESWSFPKPPTSAGSGLTSPPAAMTPPSVFVTDPSIMSHDPFADDNMSLDVDDGRPILPPDWEAETERGHAHAHEHEHEHMQEVPSHPVERVRRPFMPTLHDELAVSRGDAVRVLATFDDGWMAVERVLDPDNVEAGGAVRAGATGLIPIDCLREAGEELPAFLASRRISSHSYDGAGFAM